MPEGHLSRTPGSPRSGAEGKSGVRCSTAAFPTSGASGERGRNPFSGLTDWLEITVSQIIQNRPWFGTLCSFVSLDPEQPFSTFIDMQDSAVELPLVAVDIPMLMNNSYVFFLG